MTKSADYSPKKPAARSSPLTTGLGRKHPFPAGHLDCLEVLRAVAGHPEDYGVDPNRIAVGGDSAGGNLAAFFAIAARDEGIPLAFQVLIYPVTDARSYLRGVDQFDYASITENQEGPLLTLEGMRFFLEHTLTSEDPSAEATDWRISPILAADLDRRCTGTGGNLRIGPTQRRRQPVC